MTAVDFILAETERSYKALLDRARKVPADKLDWRPLDLGRSVMDMCQECAHSLLWPVPLIRERKFEMSAEVMEEYEATRKGWTTLDQVQAAMDSRYAELKSVALGIPADQLEQTVDMPWGNWTLIEVLALPSWNLHYHTGQINYIQTLYGDKEM